MNNNQTTQKPILPQLMQRHVAEINALWCRRRLVMTSSEHTLLDLHKIDFRIRGHTESLLAGSLHSHALLLRQEEDNDRDAEFAVTYPLLETGDDLVRKTFCQRLATVQYPILQGLRDAWMHADLGDAERYIRQVLNEGNAENAACSAEVLAMHGLLNSADVEAINKLIRDSNPFVRACAWRIARYHPTSDRVANSLLSDENFRLGLEDKDPQVRKSAGWTAAWCARFKAQSEFMHKLKSDVDLLPLFVALADHTHCDDVEAALKPLSSVNRAQLMGAFGYSGFIPMLLDEMKSSDVPRCYSAGLAYTRITGADITSDHSALLHSDPDSLDEFDKEFVQTVFLPDQKLANAHWQKHQPRFKANGRWHRGYNISSDQSPEALAAMDMNARWSMLARQNMQKKRNVDLAQLIRIRRSAPGMN